MSILFADIYEAIQDLRAEKGVREKDILIYIEERVGGCLKAANIVKAIQDIKQSEGPTEEQVHEFVRQFNKNADNPKNFMKTVQTLQKLVDDGVLIKKGKRFAFSPCSPKQNDEDDEDEGSDENEGEAELEMSDDECDAQNDCEGNEDDKDEDDDDDDDDDEDEDDDDDDDDDEDEEGNECDEEDIISGKDVYSEKNIPSKNDQKPTDDKSLKTVNQERVILSPKKTNEDSSKNSASAFSCDNKSKENSEANNERILREEARNIIKKSGDTRRTETIAFCVRDFIDSLYRPKTDHLEQERSNIPDILVQENMDATETEEIGKEKLSVGKKRKLRKKRDQSRCNYRSRSPIKKAKAEAETFHTLNSNLSDKVCYWVASNHFLTEPMEADMDIDLEKEVDVVTNYDACRHRNSVDPLQTNTSGVHANRKESFCGNQDNQKVASCFEGNNEFFLKKNVETKPSQIDNKANNQNNWFHSEEEDREQKNTDRSFSVENEMNASEEHQASLCSFCEKSGINT